uniref:Uncharacterized protein n=1 Tax=Sciurus vulgaris TaxID=55149 RepID=A0A8D2B9T4_SCIVU
MVVEVKIDLEVSEPIDFSSGDQHLVRKAADKRTQSRSDPPPTSSPSPGQQETQGNPHPKASDRAHTYVVQISDETSPAESDTAAANAFSDASVRRGFIVKVFLLLSAQLLVTATIITFFVVLIILACCGNLRRRVPANYILLGLFSSIHISFLLCVLFSEGIFYNAEEVLWATAATTLVTLALTIFALQTKWDFTLLNGMLFVLLFVLVIYGILLILIRSYWLHVLYAGLGTVLFSMYLVMDVQLMVGGRHHHSDLDPEEYVFAALNIYLDIINLFLFILQLIGLGR